MEMTVMTAENCDLVVRGGGIIIVLDGTRFFCQRDFLSWETRRIRNGVDLNRCLSEFVTRGK